MLAGHQKLKRINFFFVTATEKRKVIDLLEKDTINCTIICITFLR